VLLKRGFYSSYISISCRMTVAICREYLDDLTQ